MILKVFFRHEGFVRRKEWLNIVVSNIFYQNYDRNLEIMVAVVQYCLRKSI